MRIAVPRETAPGERRAAATPETVAKLRDLGFEVEVEAGVGVASSLTDARYAEAGAQVTTDARALYQNADIVLKVTPPAPRDDLDGAHELDLVREGTAWIGFVWPARSQELLDHLARRKITGLAMDMVPRITRAQKLDALSSMANIAGYRAVIEAANAFGRFFTGQITAAGKVPPAKVMVIGAGVAGLAAIGTARGLGAIVRAFDTRPEVKEQILSMGAEFLELDFEEEGRGEGGYAKVMSDAFLAAEIALFEEQAKDLDIIITTALIPGKPAPKLLPTSVVNALKPGSVIVDLAAETGGNCEHTKPGEVTEYDGVTIIGYTDLPSRMAGTASQLYGTNITHLLTELGGSEKWNVDFENDVIRGCLVTHDGEITWPPPKPKPAPAPPPQPKPVAAPAPAPVAVAATAEAAPSGGGISTGTLTLLVGGAVLFGLLGQVAPAAFLSHLTVFVLSIFVGWQVIWNVTPALHTPLMSVTNAISGIIIVGGLLLVAGPLSSPVTVLAAVAVLVATINIAGGFLVTQRMLRMFQK